VTDSRQPLRRVSYDTDSRKAADRAFRVGMRKVQLLQSDAVSRRRDPHRFDFNNDQSSTALMNTLLVLPCHTDTLICLQNCE
jgi:hypothetical protein